MARIAGQLLFGNRPETAKAASVIGKVLLVLIAVKDLAGTGDMIALVFETHGHRDILLCDRRLVDFRIEKIDPAGCRVQRSHHAGSRGIAHRRLAMGVGKKHSASCEPIDVRRFRLWMPAEHTNPIVKIVDADQENIRFRAVGQSEIRRGCQHERK